jgi:hypothetical protein
LLITLEVLTQLLALARISQDYPQDFLCIWYVDGEDQRTILALDEGYWNSERAEKRKKERGVT